MTPTEIPDTVRTAAAIDIGSNQIRMVLAEVLPDGEIKILEQFQRAIHIGQDTFRRGRVSNQSMRAAIAILRDYRNLIDFYHVKHIRAVATSAIRETQNTDAFLDRILMATNLDVEVIDTAEESRLTVLAVRPILNHNSTEKKSKILLAEVGGGSTLLTVIHGTEIVDSQSLPIGSIRLQESLLTSEDPINRAVEILTQRIENELATVEKNLPLNKISTIIAIGGDARFAARVAGKSTSVPHLDTISKSAFGKLIRRCQKFNAEGLTREFGIPFTDSETLNPAMLVYQALFDRIKTNKLMVSQYTMRDGLLADLARRVMGGEDQVLTEGVIHSAMSIAKKYRVDTKHSENIADLAVCLFDQLQSEHKLTPRHRLLLRVAALLHESGDFISNRAHHKHSYYVISNSEIFGLSRRELIIVALVARYHRRSGPKSTHLPYMALAREDRMIVSKLAALLRIADALDVSHSQKIRQFTCRQEENNLILMIPKAMDLSLERRDLIQKSNLFEDIYGKKVILEEADRHA